MPVIASKNYYQKKEWKTSNIETEVREDFACMNPAEPETKAILCDITRLTCNAEPPQADWQGDRGVFSDQVHDQDANTIYSSTFL